MPGVEGSLLEIDPADRDSELWRSSLGFQAEFTLRNSIYNGFWGAALIAGSSQDHFSLLDDQGDPVTFDVQRDVTGIRGSFGISMPITPSFKLRPYASLVLSQVRTHTNASGNIIAELVASDEDSIVVEGSAESVSGVATLEAEYQRFVQPGKLALSAQYNAIYTDTFSPENSNLDTWAWSDTLMARARFSRDTGWSMAGSQWEWSAFYHYSNFLGHSKSAMGFRYLNEIGMGLDWDMHIKPLDWFGWRYLGLRVGYSFGDDVSGFNVGLSAR
jgi:hypothetical protein